MTIPKQAATEAMVDMEVSPARAIVSPLVRTTASRAMEVITKAQRAALHHTAREDMVPAMGSPSQVDMDHSPHPRAMASQVSPTVQVAITAVSPRRLEATVSSPPIRATTSNSPLHPLLPAMAVAVSRQVMGHSRVEEEEEEEEGAMEDKVVVMVAVEGRVEDMEAVEDQVGGTEEVEGNSIPPSPEGDLTVSPQITVHLHLKAMDSRANLGREEDTIRIPHL